MRIEARKGIQLTLPEQSTVLIFSSGQARVEKGDNDPQRYGVKTGIEPAKIRAVFQEYDNFGDPDTGRALTSAIGEMHAAKARGVTYDQFMQDASTILSEVRSKKEGGKLGTFPSITDDVWRILTEAAEQVWTEPNQKSA